MKYSDFEHIRFDHQDNGVLTMTLDRPQAMNATNARLHWELTQVWDVFANDPHSKVAVVTGAGERAFSAGGDLDLVAKMANDPHTLDRMMKEAGAIVYNMLACDKPIISAINGIAVGAGLAVALMADISVMVDDARLTDGHARLGVSAGDHAAIIWPLLCGMSKAKYYLMTADFISGTEAERIGLVTFAVPRAQLMPRAMEIAGNLAKGSQVAIRGTKASMNNWMRMVGPIFDNSLAIEKLAFLAADAREGVDAVLNRRIAEFPSAKLPLS